DARRDVRAVGCGRFGVLQEEAVRGDVQDARRVDFFERGFRRLPPGQKVCFVEELLDGARLVGGGSEQREVDFGQIARGGHAPARAFGRGGLTRRADPCQLQRGWLAERRVGDNRRLALALARDLHAQEVAPARQVCEGVTLDEVVAALVYKRLERDEVHLAVGRDEQLRGVARERAHGPHQSLVRRAREFVNVSAVRVAERLAQGLDRAVNIFRRAQLRPAHLATTAYDIGDVARLVARRAVVRRLRVERAIDGELDERRAFGNRAADGVERDGLLLRAELRAAAVDLAFESLALLFETLDTLLVFVGGRALRPVEREPR